ncbi:IS66 family insertion sequence element accessory protein TnpA, partial [Shewanella sairae]|uniref:IS66 family insertion sequence element accessory protein TnpA n=1 Tax=Shewanella sairae TaxID=190310 RepID=UPI004033113E
MFRWGLYPLHLGVQIHYATTWSASSLSQAEFCRQENISPSAFHHWRNQLSNQRLNESVDDWI